jgi:hypothetical protein
MASRTTKTTPKKQEDIEVTFVVGILEDGRYAVVEIEEGGTALDALDNTAHLVSEYASHHVFKVILPMPKPLQPVLLVPQIG